MSKTSMYASLSREYVDGLDKESAEQVIQTLIAERATITGGGKILRWSEYNENPDPLINEMLSRVLVSKLGTLAAVQKARECVLLSIENSASYLVGALAYELADVYGWQRPPRIIRARKIGGGSTSSPAMGEQTYSVSVTPITASGKARQLKCSVDVADFSAVRCVIVVDDFMATGSSIAGGFGLARQIFGEGVKVSGVAGLGKPEQATELTSEDVVMTAVDVSFWAESNRVLLRVNKLDSVEMKRAGVGEFED